MNHIQSQCSQRVWPKCRKFLFYIGSIRHESFFSARAACVILVAILLSSVAVQGAETGAIQVDANRKLITLVDGNGQLALRLNYDGRCVLDSVVVRGREVVAASGVFSGISIDGQNFNTRSAIATPNIEVIKNTLTVTGIRFGRTGNEVRETWQFTVQPETIVWKITRKYVSAAILEDAAFPEWDFGSMSTWTGGILGNGGVVWNKYLENPNATYGAHNGTVTFWNQEHHDCLRITPALSGNQQGAARFSHQTNHTFSFNYILSGEELKPKHGLNRYLSDRQDLWAPFKVDSRDVSAEFTLAALDYDQAYDRGQFVGLNGKSIRDLLNTVARYGVIDTHLTGGNGWRSGYICLHEQWFGQIAATLGDHDYITNYSAALNYYRDHAMSPEGRVKSRWTYNAGDALTGTYDALGFYEAQWGYLLDSQPDYVINVAEQFDLTGDKAWLRGHKQSCEKALSYLMQREVNHSGLVAMLTDSHRQNKSSDWIDIIWASYENALVNAELYYALGLWAGAEDALGDAVQAAAYRDFAARLKASFNRPISEGGFWNPTNSWYVYWREKDGSVYGDNLVTPVNFAAIAYGLCDDEARKKIILDRIEAEMQKESLFGWPLSFFPYQTAEGAGSNFPFPRYENGDIFLSWGEVGVRAYAAYSPAIALKYIKKTLDRYKQDGLSYQRYLRQSQQGEGDDILAGNCMPIVGLYRDIYGIQPKPNRLYLDPHLTSELDGTILRYALRGQLFKIALSSDHYEVTAGVYTLQDSHSFGFNATDKRLEYFPGSKADWELSISRSANRSLAVQIESWPENAEAPRRWTESSTEIKGSTLHVVTHLRPNSTYKLTVSGQTTASVRTDATGRVKFSYKQGYAAPKTFELELSTSTK